MASFEELVQRYRSRQRAKLADSIAAGLSFTDEVAADLGLLEDSGLLGGILQTASAGLPFAVIALSEGGKVLLKRKTAAAGAQDAAFRALRTGASMGAGAAAAAVGGGFLPAIPVAMGVRVLLDRYRSRALTGYRVQLRIQRLRALRGAEPLRDGKTAGAVQTLPQPSLQR